MAFATIDPNIIKVGDPITKDILDLIKANFDDHEFRLNSLSVSGGSVFIFNGDISFANYSPSRSDVLYYKAQTDFSVNDFRVQLFTKQGLTSGTLSFDLEKSVDTNNANFNSILTADISFNFASDADYSVKTASIDSGLNDVLTGDLLRLKITGVPSSFTGKVIASIGAA
jgi:hypothetical protein